MTTQLSVRVWIAGRDKPHRCPDCWSSQMRRRPWSVRKWLPRKCACGAWTLTTWPRAAYGTGLHVPSRLGLPGWNVAAARPRRVDSAILHRCGEGNECFCMYDPECTGRLGRRLVRLPLWLTILSRPLHSLRVLDARRRLRTPRPTEGATHDDEHD